MIGIRRYSVKDNGGSPSRAPQGETVKTRHGHTRGSALYHLNGANKGTNKGKGTCTILGNSGALASAQ